MPISTMEGLSLKATLWGKAPHQRIGIGLGSVAALASESVAELASQRVAALDRQSVAE